MRKIGWAVCFFVYETLFPGSTKPEPPYVETPSNEAAANFRRWFESPEAVAIFRADHEATVAEAFPDASVQFCMQMILEEVMYRHAWRTGPNFQPDTGYGSFLHPSDSATLVPGSGTMSQLFGDTGSQNPSLAMQNNTTSSRPSQSENATSSFTTPPRRTNVPEFTADNGTDFTTQESLSPLLGTNPDSFEDSLECLQDLNASNTVASGHELDYIGFSGQELPVLYTSDLDEIVPPNTERPRGDDASLRSKGKNKAWQ